MALDNDEEIEIEDEDSDEEELEDEDDDEDLDKEDTEDENEEVEVEVLEFSMNYEEIDELIEKLEMLKETKIPIEFDIDEENQLLITYDEDEGEEDA